MWRRGNLQRKHSIPSLELDPCDLTITKKKKKKTDNRELNIKNGKGQQKFHSWTSTIYPTVHKNSIMHPYAVVVHHSQCWSVVSKTLLIDLLWHKIYCLLEYYHQVYQISNIWRLTYQTPKNTLMRCCKCQNIWHEWTVHSQIWERTDINGISV